MKKVKKLSELNMGNKDNIEYVRAILSEIDLELENICNQEDEDNCLNSQLKVTLIIHIVQALDFQLIKKIKPCIGKHLDSLISNVNVNSKNFQDWIYNLSQKQQILLRSNSVKKFIDFIELYKSGKKNSEESSFEEIKVMKKIIHFWVAKVMLGLGMEFVPLLCYILYKTDLMSEFSFYIMFRHSFIIKRLISRTHNNFKYAWFEINDAGKSKELINIIKPMRLLDYETFCAEWEKRQHGNLFLGIKESYFFKETNIETERKLLGEVYEQLATIYNYMNYEIKNAQKESILIKQEEFDSIKQEE